MEKEVGKIMHYYGGIGVAAVNLTDNLKVGDKIRIKGTTTDFEQTVDSMQIDRKDVQEAGPSDEIGIKVKEKVRSGDIVYKIEE